jgi:hypothetical protein
MKDALTLLLILSLLTLTAPPAGGLQSPRAAASGRIRHERAARDSYIVVLKGEVAAAGVAAEAERLTRLHGGRLVATYRHALRGFSARMSPQAAEALSRHPHVAYVEDDAIVELAATQTNAPWGLDRIDQRDLPPSVTYTYVNSGDGAHVYLIDSGIRTTHQEWGARASVAFDNVGDNQNGEDCYGHGTQVAGVVGGQTYGVAKGAALHAVRVFSCSNTSTLTKVIGGVDFVTSDHLSPAVAVLSVSTGGSTSLDTAVSNSVAAGVTYVVAAGNLNVDAGTKSPARVAEAITVGATDSSDARASFSNYGSSLDLFAPGVDIPTANWFSDTSTITQSGTSLAAAHAAGLAARYLSAHPKATPAAVGQAITSDAVADKVSSPGLDSPNLLLHRPRQTILSGSAFNDASVGTRQWVSSLGPYPHIGISDDGGTGPTVEIFPAMPVPREDISNYLRAFYFNFEVPDGDSVTTVTVTVKRRMKAGTDVPEIVDNAVHLVKDGVVQTAVNKADTSTPWSKAWVYKSYVFTCSDLSGWTAEDFEDADFGVAFSVKLRMGETEEVPDTKAQVDTIIVTLGTVEGWW